jgi:hypothetical protein
MFKGLLWINLWKEQLFCLPSFYPMCLIRLVRASKFALVSTNHRQLPLSIALSPFKLKYRIFGPDVPCFPHYKTLWVKMRTLKSAVFFFGFNSLLIQILMLRCSDAKWLLSVLRLTGRETQECLMWWGLPECKTGLNWKAISTLILFQ